MNDFKPGHGIRLTAAGPAARTFPILEPPKVTPFVTISGSHTYCYVVTSVDPLGGFTAPSPQACVTNQGDVNTIANGLTTTDRGFGWGAGQNDGPTPTFLWYVAQDGGPYQLVSVATQISAAIDNGQRPGARGGWPAQLPAGNPDISKNEDFFSTIVKVDGNQITVIDPVPSKVSNSDIHHDDTDAIQRAILAADAQGGGTVQFDTATYNLFRPEFHGSHGSHSHDIQNYFWYTGFSYLYIPDNSRGHINLQGVGEQTILRTSPDGGGSVSLIDFGLDVAPFLPEPPIAVEEVAKGSVTVTLANPSSASPQPGDDIELFTGSFAIGLDNCTATSGEPANCHFSELNTVAARNGGVITLAYPTSKRFYDDGRSNFGLVVRTHPSQIEVPHLLGLQHMRIDTYNSVYTPGNVIGMLVNDIHITGSVSHGPFAGGAKRDLTIENSSWGMGAGDISWNGTDEMDKVTNVVFRNNTVTGYAAPGAEGLSVGARIYASEGSSQFTFQNNIFTNILLRLESTTEAAVVQNTFHNGEVNLGYAYDNNRYNFTEYHNAGYLSFASQENALIDSNVFSEDKPYQVPVVILLGDFKNGSITNNIINTSSSRDIPVITSYGGLVTDNVINISENSRYSTGIALVPDPNPAGPGASITAERNVISASHVAAGIYLVSSDVTAITPVCVRSNIFHLPTAQAMMNFDPAQFNLTCDAAN